MLCGTAGCIEVLRRCRDAAGLRKYNLLEGRQHDLVQHVFNKCLPGTIKTYTGQSSSNYQPTVTGLACAFRAVRNPGVLLVMSFFTCVILCCLASHTNDSIDQLDRRRFGPFLTFFRIVSYLPSWHQI